MSDMHPITLAHYGTDAEWFDAWGKCGGCGSAPLRCDCLPGECGCWSRHEATTRLAMFTRALLRFPHSWDRDNDSTKGEARHG